jgi:hypothetical protein
MRSRGAEIPLITTELSIQEATQLVGDNHSYQHTRLAIIATIVMATAILNNQVAVEE